MLMHMAWNFMAFVGIIATGVMEPNQSAQVFINLLKNAIRYSNPNSTIEVYYKCDNYYHEIKFANTGIGIREEEKDLIFELFYRGIDAKHKIPRGTGFGLYLTREIMRAHNGDCLLNYSKKLKNKYIGQFYVRLE